MTFSETRDLFCQFANAPKLLTCYAACYMCLIPLAHVNKRYNRKERRVYAPSVQEPSYPEQLRLRKHQSCCLCHLLGCLSFDLATDHTWSLHVYL